MLSLLFSLCLVNGIMADPSLSIVGNAIATPSLSSLVEVLTAKGYEDVLKALSGEGTFTVFAPNNDAWAASSLNVTKKVDKVIETLKMHLFGKVVKSTDMKYLDFPETLASDPLFVNLNGKGQSLFIESDNDKGEFTIYFSNLAAHSVVLDIECSNGIVHIIDQVVTLPPVASNALKYSSLNVLLEAILLAGLQDAVNNTAGITIFAPTDTAFKSAGIDPNNVPVATLANILKYHVVPAVAFTTDIVDGQQIATLQGTTVTISNKAGTNKFAVNGANVITANVLLKNGVAHFIDQVLIPKNTVSMLARL